VKHHAFAVTVFVALCFFALLVGRVGGDDMEINTPVVSASLRGNWELQPHGAGEYKQTLHLGPQFSGQWKQSRETLPLSLAWFVEGGELRILHYSQPAGAFNYRVKTLMVAYKLADDTLMLTFNGKPSTWKRIREAAPARK
jgi:hypothetical protein